MNQIVQDGFDFVEKMRQKNKKWGEWFYIYIKALFWL